MHLMSFYATPYSSRHRGEIPAKKLTLSRVLWFAAGLSSGLLAMWMFSPDNSGADNLRYAMVETLEEPVIPVTPVKPIVPLTSLTNDTDALSGLQTNDAAALQPALTNYPTAPAVQVPMVPSASTITPLVPPVEKFPKKLDVTVNSGDTLISILMNHGVDHVAAHRLAKEVNKKYNLRQLRPGHTMSLILAKDTERETTDGVTPTLLRELRIHINKLKTLVIHPLGDEKYRITLSKVNLITQPARAKAVITNNLYSTASSHGLSDKTIANLIKNFSYDIDFQRDIKTGDVIDVMYETKKTPSGEIVEGGDVIYAKLKTKGKEFVQYRFTNQYGLPAYYDANGETIIKRLLKTPIDGARISSRFGMRRHPIQGFHKMHKGVDFAAPTGTPIFAAGDGIVTVAGRSGGYGNMVVVKHNQEYSTAYAHASRIAQGIRRGMRVRQGQVIAYVGTTGNSTGPHLHYEIRRYGQHVNPLNVKFASGHKLTGRQLTQFRQYVKHIHSQLASMQTNSDDQERVALAE